MKIINGITYVTPEEHDKYYEEFITVYCSEHGLDSESQVAEGHYIQFMAKKFNTLDWDFDTSDEPDDGYDYDRYY